MLCDCHGVALRQQLNDCTRANICQPLIALYVRGPSCVVPLVALIPCLSIYNKILCSILQKTLALPLLVRILAITTADIVKVTAHAKNT